MSRTKKLVFSLLTVVAFFLALEAVLTVAGVWPIAATEDPYVGFSSQLPLMLPATDENGTAILKTAPDKLVLFNEQKFAATKPARTRRIFCLGGSTTFGRPYADPTSYSNWLRELLPTVDGNTKWEVINAGGVSYASYRVATVMEELAQYDPDLFIVFSAHNEFLERRTYADMFERSQGLLDVTALLSKTRTWSAMSRLLNRDGSFAKADMLPAEVDEMLNHSVGPEAYHRDDDWKQKVVTHYRLNLSRMVKIAEHAGADIVFVTPASNEKDCSPFKSELSDDLNPQQKESFYRSYRRGIERARSRSFEVALESFHSAKLIDDRHADLHFQIGKSMIAVGHLEDASREFRRALSEDICPLRATDEISQAVRVCAAEHDVAVVDFERQLRADCQSRFGHPILGEEYFLDHVHPRGEVHGQLAVWIIESLLARSIISGSKPTEQDIETVTERIKSRLDPESQGVALRNLAKVLHWSGKFSEAQPRAADALQLLPDDPESLLIVADCLSQTGQADEALETYDHLLQIHPLYLRAMLPFAELLISRQQFERAKPLLESANGLHEIDHPDQIRIKYCLGQVHIGLGQYWNAIEVLEDVRQIFPDDSRTLFLLAQSYSGIGEHEQAVDLYRHVLTLEPYHVAAHQRLGLMLLQQQEPKEAILHFEAALKLEPDNDQLRQNLTIAKQLAE